MVRIKGPICPRSNSRTFRGDFESKEKVNWKPLVNPASVLTVTFVKASITGFGTGMGTIGPINNDN
jgi:hypothetical protein